MESEADSASANGGGPRPPLTRERVRRRRWILTGALLLVLVVLIVGRSGASVSAPARAVPGATITVRSRHLRTGGDYALTLYVRRGASIFCERQLGSAEAGTSPAFTVALPARLPCYARSSARAGTIAVTPGEYALIVAEPRGTGFDSRYSFVTKRLRIG